VIVSATAIVTGEPERLGALIWIFPECVPAVIPAGLTLTNNCDGTVPADADNKIHGWLGCADQDAEVAVELAMLMDCAAGEGPPTVIGKLRPDELTFRLAVPVPPEPEPTVALTLMTAGEPSAPGDRTVTFPP
jgi:hypothetical protein